MFDQTSQAACVQPVPQTTPVSVAIGDLIRWPLAGDPDAVALIADVESIGGWRVLSIAPAAADHGQPVRPGTLRLARLDEVRQSGLTHPVRFDLDGRVSVAPSHPGLAGAAGPVVIGHLCETALARLHAQRARIHALRDIAAARREERRGGRQGDRRTGWRAAPRPVPAQGAQEGRP